MSNREIKFRVREAKPPKRWAYFSIPHKIIWEGVWDMETLGQFTGVLDKNGIEIFEGDVLKDLEGTLAVVKYFGRAFVAPDRAGWDNLEFPDESEVIGNIYENPELLPDTNTPQGK